MAIIKSCRARKYQKQWVEMLHRSLREALQSHRNSQLFSIWGQKRWMKKSHRFWKLHLKNVSPQSTDEMWLKETTHQLLYGTSDLKIIKRKVIRTRLGQWKKWRMAASNYTTSTAIHPWTYLQSKNKWILWPEAKFILIEYHHSCWEILIEPLNMLICFNKTKSVKI